MRKRGAVACDGGFEVVLRESQVECLAAIGARKSSLTRRESVDEPGKFAQVCGAKNFEFGLLRNLLWNLLRNLDRHLSMLTVSPALAHSSQKLFPVRSHLTDQRLITGIFVRGGPEHHFSEHRGEIDSFRGQ
jgi:hypothetical protein